MRRWFTSSGASSWTEWPACGTLRKAEREYCRSEHWPPDHPEQERLTGAQPGRANQYEPPHPWWMLDRDLRGNRAAHRVPDEHSIRETERVHEGDCEASIGGVVVGGRWLVGQTESAVVERDHPKARRGHGSEVVAPGVHRGAEAV